MRLEHLAQEALSSKSIERIERIRQGIKQYRIALVCTEKDLVDCHRAILVARHVLKN